MDTCRKNGVTSATAGYSTVAVADLVFGMVISCTEISGPCNAAVRNEGTKTGLVGFELEAKIRQWAPDIGLHSKDCPRLSGVKYTLTVEQVKEIEGVTYVPLDELLSVYISSPPYASDPGDKGTVWKKSF